MYIEYEYDGYSGEYYLFFNKGLWFEHHCPYNEKTDKDLNIYTNWDGG